MEIEVKLISTFTIYEKNLENGKAVVPEGASVLNLAMRINLPVDKLGILIINGRQGKKEDILKDGDSVVFLPQLWVEDKRVLNLSGHQCPEP